jgi:hypothetical protein
VALPAAVFLYNPADLSSGAQMNKRKSLAVYPDALLSSAMPTRPHRQRAAAARNRR